MYEPAQVFFVKHSEADIVSKFLKDQRCSHADWLSLGFFAVVMATKLCSASDGTADVSACAFEEESLTAVEVAPKVPHKIKRKPRMTKIS